MSLLSRDQRPKRLGKFRRAILKAEHNRRKKEIPGYGKPTEKKLPNFVKEKVNKSVQERNILTRHLTYNNLKFVWFVYSNGLT